MKVGWRRDRIIGFAVFIILAFKFSYCFAINQERAATQTNPPAVTLDIRDKEVVIDNGILQITVASPEGYLTGVRFGGLDNILETGNHESNRGYWDVVWDNQGHDATDKLLGSSCNVVVENDDQVEVSFTHKWNTAEGSKRLPINVDRRYIMLRGSSGFYTYASLWREEGYPASSIYQIRTVYKLDQKKFDYMAISDDMQRVMPMTEDRETGLPLAYKEAVLLTNPSDPDLRGEVDDKYQYSCENKDNKVQGWISFESQIGFWIITPSNEYRSAGPVKQDLTSHVGPTVLQMFHSAHYAGDNATIKFQENEPWKKMFGPYYVHLNSISEDKKYHTLWDDAKYQMAQEVRGWPYEFPSSEDFPKSVQRGFVYGHLFVRDSYRWRSIMSASSAWIGLAAPGYAGSWQTETKGYQFWTKTNRNGRFMIKGIREGVYSLYAWVPRFIGDYSYMENITIAPGSAVNLGKLVFKPPRNGPTLWQIGVPDRTALEFHVPQPSSLFANKLYTDSHVNKFRQYGLWERYAELYPDHDLIYTVGESDYHRDWFFAQVTRKGENDTYRPTTWQIVFSLSHVISASNYTLRIALASASRSEVQVRFNDPEMSNPHFTTMLIGTDNAIARHGIHGLYWLFNVVVPNEWLRVGNNTIYLKQSRHLDSFQGVMYDYIRLEGPPKFR